jgi:hypothetical protein
MSEKSYNNTILDCLELRKEHALNDWTYLNLLYAFSKEIFGVDTNEAMLLTGYLFCQSGYKVRFGRSGEEILMLFSTQHCIYGKSCYLIEGDYFYVFDKSVEDRLEICPGSYPNETPLSLLIQEQPILDLSASQPRVLTSSAYPDMRVNIIINENIVNLCSEYPSSFIDNDFMTRWAMYANAPLADDVRDSLYSQLKCHIADCTQLEAVSKLLNWVQTAFVYEYDDNVWGDDRPFFAEETLFYPYCDCEDRAILLSHLVRDLVDLDVILVYYPGHLAMAVAFTDDVKGDHIMVENRKYVICDPTFINASVGRSMPGLETDEICVIKLNK